MRTCATCAHRYPIGQSACDKCNPMLHGKRVDSCWFADCKEPGTVQLGRADERKFCGTHAVQIAEQEARQRDQEALASRNAIAAEFCKANGLETVEQKRAFIAERIKNIGKGGRRYKPSHDRVEAGEDWEEEPE